MAVPGSLAEVASPAGERHSQEAAYQVAHLVAPMAAWLAAMALVRLHAAFCLSGHCPHQACCLTGSHDSGPGKYAHALLY